jgi:hypothetical protein
MRSRIDGKRLEESFRNGTLTNGEKIKQGVEGERMGKTFRRGTRTRERHHVGEALKSPANAPRRRSPGATGEKNRPQNLGIAGESSSHHRDHKTLTARGELKRGRNEKGTEKIRQGGEKGEVWAKPLQKEP